MTIAKHLIKQGKLIPTHTCVLYSKLELCESNTLNLGENCAIWYSAARSGARLRKKQTQFLKLYKCLKKLNYLYHYLLSWKSYNNKDIVQTSTAKSGLSQSGFGWASLYKQKRLCLVIGYPIIMQNTHPRLSLRVKGCYATFLYSMNFTNFFRGPIWNKNGLTSIRPLIIVTNIL